MNRLKESQAPSVSLKRRFFSVPTLVSFGIVAALIVLLATRFNLDWGETWDNVRRMDPWLYLLALVLYYLSFAFRGARWRILARNAGADTSAARLPSAFECSRLIIIGWFVNAVTWLRLGDAYRAYAFSQDSKSDFSWSLGTVLAERVLDMATIFAVLVVSGIYLATTRDETSAYVVVAAFVMAFVLVTLMLLMKRYGVRLARFLPGRMEDAYGRFQQGTLGSFQRLPLLAVLGLAGWALEIARVYFVIEALGLDVSFPLVPVVALGHAILSTVPTPGGLGAVEPGLVGLLLIDLGRNDAASVAVVDRSITYISVVVFGGLIFLGRQIALSRESRRAGASERTVGQETSADV